MKLIDNAYHLELHDLQSMFALRKSQKHILQQAALPPHFPKDHPKLSAAFAALNVNGVYGSYVEFVDHAKRIEKRNRKKDRDALRTKSIKNKYDLTVNEVIRKNLLDVWYRNEDVKYVIHCGPTNSGKTYNAIQALVAAESGAYLSPLRLLALEVYEKINAYVPCNLLTGEEKVDMFASHTASTIEMANFDQPVEVAVVDEAFMIADPQRGKSWFNAIMKMPAKVIHVISSLESLDLLTSLLRHSGKEYEVNTYDRKTLLEMAPRPVVLGAHPPKSVYVTFSRLDCLLTKAQLEADGARVSVLYGNLPPEIKRDQIRRYIDGETDVCVATDVIGMGLNLPCDNIIFIKTEKFDGYSQRPLNQTEAKQIAGRAGRFGMSEKGTVYACDEKGLGHIGKHLRAEPAMITHGYIPVEFDTLVFMKGNAIADKLETYRRTVVIPAELKSMLRLEDVDRFIELARYGKHINKLELAVAWEFLLLPVKKSTTVTWNLMVEQYAKGGKLAMPVGRNMEIRSMGNLSAAEDEVAKVELYLYVARVGAFKEFTSGIDTDILGAYRNELIAKITAYLLDRKIFGKKHCGQCGTELPVAWKHPNCDDCFRATRRRNHYWEIDDLFDED